MSDIFRELLKKVGSGPHTNEPLSRSEAAQAMAMMLCQEATPAQIGAFLIAHRIRRPTGEELAGMLDAYDQWGPKLQPESFDHPVTVLGIPYDGRSRTAPISPLTTLMLAAAGCPVVLHGGDRLPTKYGVPLTEVWQGLGVDWTQLSLAQVQRVFRQSRIGFVYLPHHFPLAQGLVPYREQLGKRPPIATLELIWAPYAGDMQIVAGYVHPPTERMFEDALTRRGVKRYLTVKGLEGSCDLPRDRTAILGVYQTQAEPYFERQLLVPRDYDLAGREAPLEDLPKLTEDLQSVLQGQPGELMDAAIWNGGCYLWHCGACPDLNAGLALAEKLLVHGAAARQLAELQRAIAHSPAEQPVQNP